MTRLGDYSQAIKLILRGVIMNIKEVKSIWTMGARWVVCTWVEPMSFGIDSRSSKQGVLIRQETGACLILDCDISVASFPEGLLATMLQACCSCIGNPSVESVTSVRVSSSVTVSDCDGGFVTFDPRRRILVKKPRW